MFEKTVNITRMCEYIEGDKSHRGALLKLRIENIGRGLGEYTAEEEEEIFAMFGLGCRQISGADVICETGKDYSYELLFPNYETVDKVQEFFDQLCDWLKSQAKRVSDLYSSISISCGVAFFPDDADNYEKLYDCVSFAMTESSQLPGIELVAFSKERFHTFSDKLKFQKELRYSVDHGFYGFYLAYQPIISIEGNRLIGAEALLRWNHPDYPNISPGAFIPLLEESGLILLVGRFIIETAMEQAKIWQKINPDFTIHVNLSFVQFNHGDVVNDIRELLEKTGVKPSGITFEITESGMISESAGLNNIVVELHAMGFQVALDDFGTGYSNFVYLKDYHIDIVKLDRTFVCEALEDETDFMLLQEIIRIAHMLNMRICLEGIETVEQLAIFYREDPDYIQGYVFGKPVAAKEFEKNFSHANGKYETVKDSVTGKETNLDRLRKKAKRDVKFHALPLSKYGRKVSEERQFFDVAHSKALQAAFEMVLIADVMSDSCQCVYKSPRMADFEYDMTTYSAFRLEVLQYVYSEDRDHLINFMAPEYVVSNAKKEQPIVESSRYGIPGQPLQWLELTIYRVSMPSHDGSKDQFMLLFRNVTEQKRRQIEQDEEKQRMIERLNHKNEVLFQHGISDPMTHVYNREGLEMFASEYIKRACREGKFLFFMICDVNGLKQINDNYGHIRGDEAIKMVGKVLDSFDDENLVCARIGGDEFVLMGVYSPKSDVVKRIETEMLERLKQLNMESDLPFTVSFSYGVYWDHPSNSLELKHCMRIADANMYEMKTKKKEQEGIPQEDIRVNTDSDIFFKALHSFFNEFFIANLTDDTYQLLFSDREEVRMQKGLTYDENIVSYARLYIHPDDQSMFVRELGKNRLIQKYESGTRTVNLVARRIGQNTEYRYCEYRTTLLMNTDDKIVAFSSNVDIQNLGSVSLT